MEWSAGKEEVTRPGRRRRRQQSTRWRLRRLRVERAAFSFDSSSTAFTRRQAKCLALTSQLNEYGPPPLYLTLTDDRDGTLFISNATSAATTSSRQPVDRFLFSYRSYRGDRWRLLPGWTISISNFKGAKKRGVQKKRLQRFDLLCGWRCVVVPCARSCRFFDILVFFGECVRNSLAGD